MLGTYDAGDDAESEEPAAVLDWNNNYGDDENKVILFHCGSVAQSLMTAMGTVTEHKMFAKGDPAPDGEPMKAESVPSR